MEEKDGDNKVRAVDDEEQILTEDDITAISNNKQAIKFLKTKIERLPTFNAIYFIGKLLRREPIIKDSDISTTKGFYLRNQWLINRDHTFRKEAIDQLRIEMRSFIRKTKRSMVDYDDDTHKSIQIKDDRDTKVVVVNRFFTLTQYITELCKEQGDINAKFDFKDSDLKAGAIVDTLSLQRVIIQISSKPISFNYPLVFFYHCAQCGNDVQYFSHEVESSKKKIKCQGITFSADGKTKTCGNYLFPDDNKNIIKECFYYMFIFTGQGGAKKTGYMVSTKELEPGFIDAVIFKIPSEKKHNTFFLIDNSEVDADEIILPELKKDENYVFSLQKTFDDYIDRRMKLRIYGMYPMKAALILQKAISILEMNLNGNIQIVGDTSTGKSLILRHYGTLLYSSGYIPTSGISCSVPGLRGTREATDILGIGIKTISLGLLGSYYCIHIDEAGCNRELIDHLKVFLFDNNYGYEKAGSEGISNKRIAHVNLSENLNTAHLGMYRGSIRKAYKDVLFNSGDSSNKPWNEDWDLHKPLYQYTDNQLLYRIIRDKRKNLSLENVNWIDGYEYALHERFPFYFFLVDEKKTGKYNQIIGYNYHAESDEMSNIMAKLFNRNINRFFNSLKQYLNTDDATNIIAEVEKIMIEYGCESTSRLKKFYINIVNLSRIINQRKNFEAMDFNLLRYMIENTNTKLDIEDSDVYGVKQEFKINMTKVDDEIEDVQRVKENIGLPDGEFK